MLNVTFEAENLEALKGLLQIAIELIEKGYATEDPTHNARTNLRVEYGKIVSMEVIPND